MTVGRVKLRCEAEADTDSRPRAARDLVGSQVDAHPEGLERVGAVDVSDDAARFAVLDHRDAAAATTIAAIVDRLTVFAPSPPVPTTSTVSFADLCRSAPAARV